MWNKQKQQINYDIYWFLQKKRKSSVLAMELRFFPIQPSLRFMLLKKILRPQRSQVWHQYWHHMSKVRDEFTLIFAFLFDNLAMSHVEEDPKAATAADLTRDHQIKLIKEKTACEIHVY